MPLPPLIKPDYKYMRVILNQCLRLHLARMLPVALLYAVLAAAVQGTALLPLLLWAAGGARSGLPLWSMAAAWASLVPAVNVVHSYLAYGFMLVVARLVEKRFVTIGFLFAAFRDRQLRTAKLDRAGWLRCPGYAVAAGLGAEALFLLLAGISPLGGVLCLLGALLLSALYALPFSFLWLIFSDKPGLPFRQALGLGTRYAVRRFFHLLGFLFSAGGMDLVTALVTVLMLCIFPTAMTALPSMRIMLLLLCMSGLLSVAKLLVRVSFSLAVYYYSLTGVLHIHRTEEAAQ